MQIDTGWENVYDRLHAHIEKQRLSEFETYILDPMTAQLTHETRLPNGPVIVTGISLLYQ